MNTRELFFICCIAWIAGGCHAVEQRRANDSILHESRTGTIAVFLPDGRMIPLSLSERPLFISEAFRRVSQEVPAIDVGGRPEEFILLRRGTEQFYFKPSLIALGGSFTQLPLFDKDEIAIVEARATDLYRARTPYGPPTPLVKYSPTDVFEWAVTNRIIFTQDNVPEYKKLTNTRERFQYIAKEVFVESVFKSLPVFGPDADSRYAEILETVVVPDLKSTHEIDAWDLPRRKHVDWTEALAIFGSQSRQIQVQLIQSGEVYSIRKHNLFFIPPMVNAVQPSRVPTLHEAVEQFSNIDPDGIVVLRRSLPDATANFIFPLQQLDDVDVELSDQRFEIPMLFDGDAVFAYDFDSHPLLIANKLGSLMKTLTPTGVEKLRKKCFPNP